MADVLRSVPWRSAELAGDQDVAGFADGRLLHPRLFGALRRSAKQTIDWLEAFDVPYDHLRMRTAGDFTPDEELKRHWRPSRLFLR